MSRKQYYALLQEKWAQVDQNNLAEIREYNEYARMLRRLMEEDDDE